MKSAKKSKLILAVVIVILMSYILSACSLFTNDSDNDTTGIRTVMDMANREVIIPKGIDKIYAADAGCTILLYTIAPETLLGWAYEFNDVEKEFILPEYRDLPVFGMGLQVNYEAVISNAPDIAILSGTNDESTVEKANNLEETLGIPVVVVDLELSKAPEAYTLMGEVIGNTKLGKKLSDYAQDILDSVVDIPDDEIVTIYYANGVDNLNTSARNTAASQLFDILHAQNVCELTSDSGDRIQVTKEHLLSWNPDYIFANGEPKEDVSGATAATDILNNPEYAEITAVKNNNVISIPKAPFAWLDRPRSENRLIGIKWLGSIIYPEYYSFDDKDIKEFYKLFYHMDLTDEQVADLLSQ